MFGGSTEPSAGSDDKQPKLADTTLLQFSELLHVHVHGRALCQEYRVSWVRVPSEAVHLF